MGADFLPLLVVPRLTEGDADLEDGSALLRPPKRCTGGRVEASAPSCDIAAAEDVSLDVESFSAGVGGFSSALPSSLGVTASVGALVADPSNVCGVVVSVASLVVSVALPAAAPPLAPPRAPRLGREPLVFGGIRDLRRCCRVVKVSRHYFAKHFGSALSIPSRNATSHEKRGARRWVTQRSTQVGVGTVESSADSKATSHFNTSTVRYKRTAVRLIDP